MERINIEKYMIKTKNKDSKNYRIFNFTDINQLIKVMSIPLGDTSKYSNIFGTEKDKATCMSHKIDLKGKIFYFKNFNESIIHMKKGWDNGAYKIIKNIKNNPLKLNNYDSNKPNYDVIGGNASVPRYLQGIPTNMINKKNVTKKVKVINFYKTYGYSASFTVDRMLEEASKSIQVIKYYESKGYRINLYGLKVNKSNNALESHAIFGAKIKLKDAHKPLNIKKLSFYVANPDFQRRIMWRIYELSPDIKKYDWSYGTALDNEDKYISMRRNMITKDIELSLKAKELYSEYLEFDNNDIFLPIIFNHDLNDFISDLNDLMNGVKNWD